MELYEIIVVMFVKYGDGCVEDLLVSRCGTRPLLCAAAAVGLMTCVVDVSVLR